MNVGSEARSGSHAMSTLGGYERRSNLAGSPRVTLWKATMLKGAENEWTRLRRRARRPANAIPGRPSAGSGRWEIGRIRWTDQSDASSSAGCTAAVIQPRPDAGFRPTPV